MCSRCTACESESARGPRESAFHANGYKVETEFDGEAYSVTYELTKSEEG